MTALAQCPVCGQQMAVRTNDRLPAHWWSELEKRHREAPCEGSQMGTRFWPTTETADGPVRRQRTT